MSHTIFDRAADPRQYDGADLKWEREGDADSPMRRFMLSYLTPAMGDVTNKKILDIGCGSGWLLNRSKERGASIAVGVDPSSNNIRKAEAFYPDVHFEQASLDSFVPKFTFDLVTAVMVFEHLPNLDVALNKIRSFLKTNGTFVLVVGDFKSFTRDRYDYKIKRQFIDDGSVAVEVERPNSSGIMCDIIRPLEHYINTATSLGFTHHSTIPMVPTEQLLAEEPRFTVFPTDPIFQLLVLSA